MTEIRKFRQSGILMILFLFMALSTACTEADAPLLTGTGGGNDTSDAGGTNPEDTGIDTTQTTPGGNGTDTSGTDTSGTDTSGTDTSGTDTSGTDTSGTDTSGTDTSGTDTSGTDTSGTDTGTGPVGDFVIQSGGYLVGGPWHGYAWTSPGEVAGATITPEDFSAVTGSESQLCVSGSLPAADDAVGILGWNINQGATAGAPVLSWSPGTDYAGIHVNITKAPAATVRLQITANGVDYCTDLNTGGNTVSFSQLRTECWGSTGTPYAGQPITQVILVAPGSAGGAVTFNYCLNEMYPIEAVTGPDTDTGGGGTGSFDIQAGGYVVAGPWHGYAWTSAGEVAGSTILPADFSAITGSETQLCVNGSLAASYDAVGILGLNVNQAAGEGSPTLTWTPASHTGVSVNITKVLQTTVRLQVTAGGVDYCTALNSGANTVLWSQLRTECWGATGTAYAGQAITQVMVMVPGDLSTVTFSFCLNEIYPM